jgi:hypothetical protein
MLVVFKLLQDAGLVTKFSASAGQSDVFAGHIIYSLLKAIRCNAHADTLITRYLLESGEYLSWLAV